MYEAFFGLSRRPFASVARPDLYVPAQAIEAARQTLVRCIERAEGVGMVVGPSGTGKTLLCQLLAEQFREAFSVVLLAGGRLPSRKALLQAILYEMGRPYRGMDDGELRLALVDYLTLDEESKGGMVLLVDEAHTLPLRLLEEIRMVANLVSRGEARARLVLAGGAVLEERFASPKLESFNQRITARCYLESLGRSETEEYVQAQIGAAGGTGHAIFPSESCQAVYQATDGIPRLVNQVCDHALLLAYADGQEVVEPCRVEEAWADLQQLPTPWNGDADEEGTSAVIEFGGLDDDDDLDEADAGRERQTLPMLRVTRDEDDVEDMAGEPALDETFEPAMETSAEETVSAEPEPPVASTGVEPAERIEQIQQTLAELEDDFQPAGTIGPEVELVFGEVASAASPVDTPAEDPFAEQFAEEETICAGHVPVRRGEAVAPPSLHDEVPQEVGRVEPPVAASVEIVQPATVPLPQPEPEDVDETAQDEPVESAASAAAIASVEPEPAGHSECDAGPDTGDAEAETGELEPETFPMHREEPALPDDEPSPDDDESDVIIVEEGYDESEHSHRPNAAPVRRQEFGRLFATLRQGR